MQCSAIQYNAVQCSSGQFIAVQCSAIKCSAVQCSAVQCSAVHISHVLSAEAADFSRPFTSVGTRRQQIEEKQIQLGHPSKYNPAVETNTKKIPPFRRHKNNLAVKPIQLPQIQLRKLTMSSFIKADLKQTNDYCASFNQVREGYLKK